MANSILNACHKNWTERSQTLKKKKYFQFGCCEGGYVATHPLCHTAHEILAPPADTVMSSPLESVASPSMSSKANPGIHLLECGCCEEWSHLSGQQHYRSLMGRESDCQHQICFTTSQHLLVRNWEKTGTQVMGWN